MVFERKLEYFNSNRVGNRFEHRNLNGVWIFEFQKGIQNGVENLNSSMNFKYRNSKRSWIKVGIRIEDLKWNSNKEFEMEFE